MLTSSRLTVIHSHASVQVLLCPLGSRHLLAKTLRISPLDDLFLWKFPGDNDGAQYTNNTTVHACIFHLPRGDRLQLFEATYQLCKLFVNDVFDRDVVYLVMTAQPLCNCRFAHCWWSYQADPDRL